MKPAYLIISLFLISIYSYGQEKFLTKQGYISFFSSTPVEDIKAENHQILSIIDTSNGHVAIAVLMKSFLFEKSLMQEHFNENYVESDVFPKATFKGEIMDFDSLDIGEHEVSIKGEMTIHGVTKEVETKSLFTKTKEGISLNGTFTIAVADYNISIPSVVANNIAKEVAVNFELNHQPYTK